MIILIIVASIRIAAENLFALSKGNTNDCVSPSGDFKITVDFDGNCDTLRDDDPITVVASFGPVFKFDSHGRDIQCQDGSISSEPPNGACTSGTDKNDNLIGSSGNNCIDGKGGNDRITGLAGNDKLTGGDGKDLLSGGNGDDELTGGNGADKFQCGAGNDRITDFSASQGDKKTNDCEQF